MWRLCKESVPTSLHSREGDGINPNIMKFIRQWQWCWHQNKDDLLDEAESEVVPQTDDDAGG